MVLRNLETCVRASCVVLVLAACTANAAVVNVRLNNLDVGIDDSTGSIVSLSYSATGAMIETSSESAGLVDLAYPVEAFAPMRLASRFSKARVAKDENGVTITWDMLGPSRGNFPLPKGPVSAVVTIKAAQDGRSVILRCRIENHSTAPIPQILFPDLWGLKAFAGNEGTQLRLAAGVVHPFTVPYVPPEAAAPYYERIGWRHYPAGAYYDQNALRWLDFGGLHGGLSVFQKQWRTTDRPNILTYRSEKDPTRLRLAWEHKKAIEAGQSWDSGEFWLTPHPGGWAKGIEVFRDYVNQVNPPRALPRQVRDGLGYRTAWMIQQEERDPAKAFFRFSDLPLLAKDAHENGLDELVLWNWNSCFLLPVPIRSELGTDEEFLHGVREAQKLGVDVSAWVSVHIIRNTHIARYGVAPGHDNWTFHPELIPQFTPYYTHGSEGNFISDNNKLWQQDVLAALTEWMNRGIYSFSWDQFMYELPEGQKPGLVSLIEKVRDAARAKDPESSFGSESITNLEYDTSVLDYTWNWLDYVDAAPVVSVLHSPRLNCNVDDSVLVVKKCFADDLYINMWTSKPDLPNGTALISERPMLSQALKQVAALRKQFLPYFVEGTFIGDSVSIEPTSAFVRGYRNGKNLLVIALNDSAQAQNVSIQSDLDLWIPSTKSYVVTSYDSQGKPLGTSTGGGPHWSVSTQRLQPLELAFFEIKSE